MIIEKEEMRPVKVVEAYDCDRCKKRIGQDDWIEFQEMVHITGTGGYGSILGDGMDFSCDLCQRCFKEVLGPFLQLKGYRR